MLQVTSLQALLVLQPFPEEFGSNQRVLESDLGVDLRTQVEGTDPTKVVRRPHFQSAYSARLQMDLSALRP